MLNVGELREGNWVLDCMGTPGEIVFGLGGFDITNRVNGYSRAHTGSAIPLTPEILEKCGFEKQGSEWHIQQNGFTECFEFKQDRLHYTGGEGVKFGIGCQYLHQLQNLYFALTGEELKVTI